MKKPFFCMLLTLCMALTFLPAIGMAKTVYVEDEGELKAEVNAVSADDIVKLKNNIEINSPLVINGTVTLDLNGYVLKQNGSGRVITIESSGVLTLEDSRPNNNHTDASLPAGGVITGGKADRGGGVLVNQNGTFTMQGGTISGCSATYYGGGVFVDAYGKFTMQGGTISDCSATYNGGGVFVLYDTFTMQGGLISDCSAEDYGDGVYVAPKCTFNMQGGTISGCSAKTSDGVYNAGGTLQNTSTTDATICYGELVSHGGIEGNRVEFYNGDALYAWEIVPQTDKAVKPADPQKSGFVLEGWYREETFENKWNFVTGIVKENMPLYANMIPAPKTANLPQTGDSSHGALWLALLMVSGGALAGAAACCRRKKASAK